MAELTCPKCDQVLRVDDAACPNCGAAIARDTSAVAEKLAPPTPQNMPFFDRHRPRAIDDDLDIQLGLGARKWNLTRIGLRVLWWVTLVSLLSTQSLHGLTLAVPAAVDFRNPGPAQIAMLGLGCAVSMTGMLVFVGYGLCCTTPDTRARRFAIMTIIFSIATVLAQSAFFAVIMLISIGDPQQRQVAAAGQPPDPQVLFEKLGWCYIVLLTIQAAIMAVTSWSWLQFNAAVASALECPGLRRLAMIVLGLAVVLVPVDVFVSQMPNQWLNGLDEIQFVRLQKAIVMAIQLIIELPVLVLYGRLMSVLAAKARNDEHGM